MGFHNLVIKPQSTDYTDFTSLRIAALAAVIRNNQTSEHSSGRSKSQKSLNPWLKKILVFIYSNNKQTMKRFAFKMFLKPGCEEEYQKRHAAIWPELVKMIKEQGVQNYSIYWDRDTNILFAYQECTKEGNSQDTENVDPVTQRWWDMMADLMEVNPDNSPVSIPLPELFHLD